ncbi:hypothetical protein Mapa_009129 [Marchantia paleacea]|nr:hypothetical protein Mapa_009129 [Marchantia paleacea]
MVKRIMSASPEGLKTALVSLTHILELTRSVIQKPLPKSFLSRSCQDDALCLA